MKALITGAAGYIGSRLAARLLKNNRIKIQPVYRIKEPLLRKIIFDFSPDVIINTACKYQNYSKDESLNNQLELFESNYYFPLRILNYCAQLKKNQLKKLPRFISIGTSLPPELNDYALSKHLFTLAGREYHRLKKIEFINIKLENYYGIDEPETRFISSVIKKLRANAPLDLTEGTQHRDFIFANDVFDIIEFILECDISETDIPAGSGCAPALREIIEYLKDITNSSSPLNFGALPMREYEPNTPADLSILRKLGFIKPLTHWKDGLKLLCGI